MLTMSAKRTSGKQAPLPEMGDVAVTDAEIERFLAERHDEVETKLAEARKSIARGEAAPLEPLPMLLRQARRSAKTVR
jgi:hypothetical protein